MQWTDVTARPPERTLRQFAALWLIFFVSLGLWRWLHGRREWDAAIIAVGLVVGGLGLARPAAIRWIFTGWMMAAFPIGWTVSQVMLAGLFYGLFTPVAAIFKLIGRDAHRVRRREKAESHWLPKTTPSDVRDYFRQF